MSNDGMNPTRRRLIGITTGLGVIGAAFAATPFVLSMTPSERAKAAGAPVEVDISGIKPGEIRTIEWRGKPVWILYRTQEMLDRLPGLANIIVDPESENENQQPEYAKNLYRSIKPEILVVVGICTHLGCSPTVKKEAGAVSGQGDNWPGGFFCQCHGSKFDLAGRVYKNVPAPSNLVVPPYAFIDDNKIIIGVDKTKGVA